MKGLCQREVSLGMREHVVQMGCAGPAKTSPIRRTGKALEKRDSNDAVSPLIYFPPGDISSLVLAPSEYTHGPGSFLYPYGREESH